MIKRVELQRYLRGIGLRDDKEGGWELQRCLRLIDLIGDKEDGSSKMFESDWLVR